MIIIPSIDLQNGKCVRLVQGDFKKVSTYTIDPMTMASQFLAQGANTLHVVDLDGAKNGKIVQISHIQNIRAAFPGILQVGGGVRTTADIEKLLALGVDRVVVGSSVVTAIKTTQNWLTQFGPEKIVLALDFNMLDHTPYVAVNGWQQKTTTILWEILTQYPNALHILCTDIGQDGMQAGPNFSFYAAAKQRYPNIYIQASGGITTLEDILQLKNLQIDAAIIGKSLHENTLNLPEAIACLK